MKEYNINIYRFLKRFDEVYDFLYKHHDQVAGFQEAMSVGDWFISNRKEFIREFNEARGDILSSDREVAAFGYVLMYEVGKY